MADIHLSWSVFVLPVQGQRHASSERSRRDNNVILSVDQGRSSLQTTYTSNKSTCTCTLLSHSLGRKQGRHVMLCGIGTVITPLSYRTCIKCPGIFFSCIIFLGWVPSRHFHNQCNVFSFEIGKLLSHKTIYNKTKNITNILSGCFPFQTLQNMYRTPLFFCPFQPNFFFSKKCVKIT